MQNGFQEPVKIIKKSELNYYILLPETKNSATNVVTNTKDIRSVTLNSYKYEGADVDNGYVKININTSKPLYFNISTKLNSNAKNVEKQTVANLQPKIEAKTKVENIELPVQKKNSDFKQNRQDKKIVNLPKKIIPVLEQAIVKKNEEVTDFVPEDEFVDENQYNMLPQENISGELENIEVVSGTNLKEQEYLDENFEEISKMANANLSSFAKLKLALKNRLLKYNLGIKDLFLMIFVGIFSFIIMFSALLSKQKRNATLKSKKELLNKTGSPFVPKEDVVENNGQYFIFNDGIKQTGLIGPATSDEPKKYELSSYEPDLKDNYVPGSFKDYAEINEYDIIQKALKDQAPRDYSNIAVEKHACVDKNIKSQNVENSIKEEIQTQKEIINKKIESLPTEKTTVVSEPIVLSRVEIAPERGFMCVSYNDNINLIGFIFDDVFPLYNFRQTKLENYEIKYRLSDRTVDGANFIVKVDRAKVLVCVKNSTMKLEVVL